MSLIWEQRIGVGFAAAAAMELGTENPLQYRARQYLTATLNQESIDLTLRSLPPVALHLLNAVAHHPSTRYLFGRRYLGSSVATQIEKQVQWLESADSDYARARVFTSHLLWSSTGPRRLAALWKHLFGSTISPVDHLLSFESDIQTLRDPFAATYERSQAVARIGAVMAASRPWAQVENLVCPSMYAWPVLVFDNSASSAIFMAISLPVGIDIRLDDTVSNRGRRAPRRPNVLVEPGHLDLSEWRQRNLVRASFVAKALWRAQHGHCGDFRDVVHNAQVTFDFRIASRVLGALLSDEGPAAALLRIRDSSADAYFAQAVLSRLLGGTKADFGLMTGAIAERRQTADGARLLDWKLGAVDVEGLGAKLRFAFAAHAFEYIILSKDGATINAVNGCIRQLHRRAYQVGQLPAIVQRSRVHHVKWLSSAARLMQGNSFERCVIVRAPDVGLGLKRPPATTPGLHPIPTSPSRDACRLLTALQGRGSIKRVAASAYAVGETLYELNSQLRRNLPRDRYGHPPPKLAAAILRVLPTEQDGRFWRLLWQIIGAPDTDLQRLQVADHDAAVGIVARALNQQVPTREAPSHRAPDLIFILGVEELEKEAYRNRFWAHRPLLVMPLLGRLERELRRTADDRYERLIANTRIILVDGACALQRPQHHNSAWRVGRILHDAPELRSLAVFHHGFRYEDACFMLRGHELRRVAAETQTAVLAHDLLRWSLNEGFVHKFGGTFFLEPVLREELLGSVSPEERIGLECYAAAALSPLAGAGAHHGVGAPPRLDLARTHQSLQHLDDARRLAQRCGIETTDIRESERRIRAFTEPLGWGMLRIQCQKREWKQAYECALELEEEYGRHGQEWHPLGCIQAMRAAYGRIQQGGGEAVENLERWREMVGQWRCKDKVEDQVIGLARTIFELIEARDRGDLALAGQLARKAREDLLAGIEPLSIDDADLLCIGGMTQDALGAWDVYDFVRRRSPNWIPAWAACLGCARVLEWSEKVEELRRLSPPGPPVSLLKGVKRACQLAEKEHWGVERVKAALDIL